MSVTYYFLDKDKKTISTYPKAACFGTVQYHGESKEAVYFRYKVFPAIGMNLAMDYVLFLNSIKWFPKINVEEFRKKQTYTFKITSKNSFKIFALFTAMRYLEEFPQVVKFILHNKDNKKISRLKLLLAGVLYLGNNGHGLTAAPTETKQFVQFKLSNDPFKPDEKIVSTGLHMFFGDWKGWSMTAGIKKEILNHYKLTLV